MNSYLKLCTEFYDIDKPTAPPEALAFYLRYAERSDGPILEPMCGSGRFLIPMMRRNLDIEGIDASPHMLGACREHCAKLGLVPRLQEQFLHELSVSRRFGLAFIPSGSLNLITDPEQVKESLRRVHSALVPSAKFVFETGQRKPEQSASWPWGGRWVRRPDGARIIISWLGGYDASTSIGSNIHRYDLIKDGRLLASEFEEFDMRHYSMSELRELLEAAGFDQIRVLKAYADRAPDETDEDVVVECTRP